MISPQLSLDFRRPPFLYPVTKRALKQIPQGKYDSTSEHKKKEEAISPPPFSLHSKIKGCRRK